MTILRTSLRVAKRAAVAAAMFVVVPLVVGVLVARSGAGRAVLRRLVLAEARKTVPGLDVGALGGGLLHDLSLRDVEIRDADGAPALRFDLLTVRYRLWPLLHHRVVVEDVALHGLRVVVRPDGRGGTNLEHLTAPAPASKAAPKPEPSRGGWSVAVEHVLVDGASGELEPATGETSRLEGLRLEGGLRLSGDDAAAWVRDVSARAEVGGRALRLSVEQARVGLGPRAVEATVDAVVGGLLPDGRALSVRADANGPFDRVETHVGASAERGAELTLEGTLGLSRGKSGQVGLASYDLAARALAVDPAALVEGAPDGRLSLTVHADGEGLPLGPGARARVDVHVARSTLGALGVDAAHLAATAHGREIVADAALRVRTVEGRGRRRRPPASGHGQLALHAEGTPESMSVRGSGDVSKLAVGGARIGHGKLAVEARGVPSAPTGSLGLVAGDVLVARDAPLVERAYVELTSEHGRLSLRASARGPRARAAVAAAGVVTARAADLSIEQLALDVTTRRYRQQLSLVRPARLRFRAGRDLTVEDVVIAGAGAQFTGQAALEGEIGLGPSGIAPRGRVALRLTKASTRGLPPVDAELSARLGSARAAVDLTASMPSAAAHLTLHADLPVVVPRSGPPRLAAHGPLDVSLKSNRVRLQAVPGLERVLARAGITGGTVSIDLAATGDVSRPEARLAFDVREVMYRNLAGLGRDSTLKTVPGLGGSLTLEAHAGSLTAEARLLIRDAGVLDVRASAPVDLRRLFAGERPTSAPLRATLSVPGLRLASLANFTDGLKGVDGRLRADVQVTGTVTRPSGTADVAVDDAQVDKLRFKQVLVHADADPGRVQARLAVEEATGGRLDGSLTLDRARGDRLEAYATAKDLDVSFARVFLPRVREIGGLAQASVTAKGTLAAPKVWGSLSLGGGKIGVVGQPTFKDVRVAATLEPGRFDLKQLEMSSGDGNLGGKGWVTLGGASGLGPQRAVLQAHAHRFLVAVAGKSGARIDGDLAVDAALRADVVEGKIDVPDANVWLSKTPAPTGGARLQKLGPHGDVHFVDPTAVAAAARDVDARRRAAATALRVALKATASPVYVRGKDMDIEVRSDVQIGTVPSGPHRGAVTLAGAVHIPRGRMAIQGQRFDFDHGDVRFDGSWDVNPALDIKLTRQYPDALVIIELRGTPRAPQLRLSSEPAIYDQSQIVSLILTGQPGGQPSSGKPFDPTAAVATAVLSRLADRIAPELGLDVMRVEKQDVTNDEGVATGDTDTRVEVGKYISERVYLSYAHIFGAPATANQNEAHVEYRMTRRWMLETIFGDAGQGGLDALWTYRF